MVGRSAHRVERDGRLLFATHSKRVAPVASATGAWEMPIMSTVEPFGLRAFEWL